MTAPATRTPDAAHDLRTLLLGACALEPDGVRAQWLGALAPDRDAATLQPELARLEEAGQLEFRDGMLRATADGIAAWERARADAGVRSRIHDALADGIARTSYHGASVRGMIARHLAAAGRTAEAQAVLVDEARLALRSCRPEVALGSLDVAAELGPLDVAARALHGRSARFAGDARAADLWRLARDEAIAAGDVTTALRAAVELVLLGAEAPATLDAATSDEPADDGSAGWHAYAAALGRYYAAAWNEGIARASDALAHARTHHDADLELASLRLVANAYASMGHLDLAAKVMHEATRLADLAGDPFALSTAYLGLIETLVEALRTDEALAAVAELEHFVRTRGVPRLEPLATALRASVTFASGRFTGAVSLASRAASAAARDTATPGTTEAYVALIVAESFVAAGADDGTADQALAHTEGTIRAFGFASYAVRLEALAAWHALRGGDPGPAAALARSISPDDEPIDASFLGLVAARARALDGARGATDLAPLRPSIGVPSPYVELAWREIDAIATGDREGMAAVADDWTAAGRRWDAAMASLVHARLALDSGEVDAAERLALFALRELLAAGAHPDVRAARAVVAAIGRMPADPTGLLGCVAFADLDPLVLAELVHDARRVEVGAGAAIDTEDAGVVIVGEGTAFVVDEEGPAAAILAVKFSGDAHVDSWYRAQVASGDGARRLLVAATDVVAWTIPSATVRAACVREPRLVGALVAVADGDAADVRELASELATLGFPQRLARLLLRLLARRGRATLRGEAMVDAVLTNEQLARMCGSQRPRVSTLMAAWKRDGIIDTWKRRTVVLDTARLRDAAGLATPADARPADA